jgi:Ca2+-transporting ATPase
LIVVAGLVGSFLLGLHDDTGRLLLPLTAAQLLWVNIVTDGPPALALGLDEDNSVLRRPPRDPKSSLLDQKSRRFIVITGTFKALVAGLLLVGLPRFGYGSASTRTLLFLYMSIGQLLFAYPARRIAGRPPTNFALHAAVIFCTGLQVLTVVVPSLRTLLGLESPEALGFMWVGAAIALSWAFADIYSRISSSRTHRN